MVNQTIPYDNFLGEKNFYFLLIIFLSNLQHIFLRRRDGRAVECGGLENR